LGNGTGSCEHGNEPSGFIKGNKFQPGSSFKEFLAFKGYRFPLPPKKQRNKTDINLPPFL
jgi:hypothetical protein